MVVVMPWLRRRQDKASLFHFSQAEPAAGLGAIKKQLCHFGISKDKPCQNLMRLVLYKHTVFPHVTVLPDYG
jgi:hypothetical protein